MATEQPLIKKTDFVFLPITSFDGPGVLGSLPE